MKINLFGIKIYVSYTFCAVLCLMLCLDRTGLAPLTLLSVFLHEAAHLFTMYVTDCMPLEIRLIPASVQIVKKPFCKDENTLAVSLSGPLFNISVALTAFLNYNLYRKTAVFEFAVINASLGFFNLLPVSGLDGGTLLQTLLIKKYGIAFSRNTVRITTVITGLLCLAAGCYFYFKNTFNLSVFIVAAYLFVCAAMGK